MIVVLFVIFLIFALLNLFLFNGSILMSIGTILFAIVGIGVCLLKNRFSPKIVRIMLILCIALCIITLCGTGNRTKNGGVQDYEKRIESILKLLEDEKLDKAIEKIEEMETLYGQDDNTKILRGLECLLKGNLSEAYWYINNVKFKTVPLYYSVMEQIYLADSSEEAVTNLYQLYQEAAKNWTDWAHMQKYAGISYLEQNNYIAAEYYLLRAFELDDTDYRTAYYLGAVKYYLNDYEQSRQYFNESIKLGADNETCSNIIWYVEQMEEGE